MNVYDVVSVSRIRVFKAGVFVYETLHCMSTCLFPVLLIALNVV